MEKNLINKGEFVKINQQKLLRNRNAFNKRNRFRMGLLSLRNGQIALEST